MNFIRMRSSSSQKLLRTALRGGRRFLPRLAYQLNIQLLTDYYAKLGVRKGIVGLTFDCDYQADLEAIEPVRDALDARGIKTTWLVIGETLRRFRAFPRGLITAGHELANHTLTHPDSGWLRPNDPRKFDQITFEERRAEIEGCHKVAEDVLGYEMRGFRAPHFRMTNDTYEVLSKLNYLYSSSKLYNRDEKLGAIHPETGGVLELPLIAAPVAPYLVPSTYYLRRASQKLYRSDAEFFAHFKALVELTAQRRLVTVIYLDPCDLVGLQDPPFERYVEVLAESGNGLWRMDQIALSLRSSFAETSSQSAKAA